MNNRLMLLQRPIISGLD